MKYFLKEFSRLRRENNCLSVWAHRLCVMTSSNTPQEARYPAPITFETSRGEVCQESGTINYNKKPLTEETLNCVKVSIMRACSQTRLRVKYCSFSFLPPTQSIYKDNLFTKAFSTMYCVPPSAGEVDHSCSCEGFITQSFRAPTSPHDIVASGRSLCFLRRGRDL